MKYWNKARIRRVKARRARAEERSRQRALERERQRNTYTPGAARKNATLMLEALGRERNRRMLVRLAERGAMSVTHLARPFGLSLPIAMKHVQKLERAGLITTHKQGRIRFCVYRPDALRELSRWLESRDPLRGA